MINLQNLTREEAFAVLNTHPNLTVKDFRTILGSLRASNHRFKVDTVKIGDIIKATTLGCHPVVIISIKNDICYGLLITSEEKTDGILGTINSRYISGYITSTLVVITKTNIIDKIYTIYGNTKELTKYKQIFKNLIKNI